ncbi:hypothetical protein QKU48_gp0647 [Fadolivirus algeromassiliense]|jgi:hypothetical protein|uniref:Uncharacterized protein n=1 Tax=Fadolivirus FV1/VV64 TaxID=3070911 RepID=A0A7D3QUG3_9VIRU|nr:hypothetical protein QKU48_gp0647 [Fadolivirus algeromassiliense]QKF94105.1 hypothetical protein Fadolivirus_1_647 [Fadolivirus FV1/VV64]
MESDIKFTSDINLDGTHFLGYLYVNESYLNMFSYKSNGESILLFDSMSQYKYDPASFEHISFEELVARLNNLSDQNIFSQGDGYKLSFELLGTYKNKPFTLYDYKGDNCVHIGGNDCLDVGGLKNELIKLINTTNPKDYTAKYHYDNFHGKEYFYKN